MSRNKKVTGEEPSSSVVDNVVAEQPTENLNREKLEVEIKKLRAELRALNRHPLLQPAYLAVLVPVLAALIAILPALWGIYTETKKQREATEDQRSKLSDLNEKLDKLLK